MIADRLTVNWEDMSTEGSFLQSREHYVTDTCDLVEQKYLHRFSEYVITPEGTAIRHDIEHQIDELSKLEAGWLDGIGEKPSDVGLNWLRDMLLEHYTAKAPELHLYPTEDGNVLAEWWVGSHDVTLEIDLSSRKGYWHDYDSSTKQTEEQPVDCNKKACWIWIIRTLRDIDQNARLFF